MTFSHGKPAASCVVNYKYAVSGWKEKNIQRGHRMMARLCLLTGEMNKMWELWVVLAEAEDLDSPSAQTESTVMKIHVAQRWAHHLRGKCKERMWCEKNLWSRSHFPHSTFIMNTHPSWLETSQFSGIHMPNNSDTLECSAWLCGWCRPDLDVRKRSPSIQANPKSVLHVISVVPSHCVCVCMSGWMSECTFLLSANILTPQRPAALPNPVLKTPFHLKRSLLSFPSACLCWCPPGRNILQGMYRCISDKGALKCGPVSWREATGQLTEHAGGQSGKTN